MLLSVSYRTMGFQDGSGPNGIEWNGYGPLADQLQTKHTNSFNCTIAFKFYMTKKTGGPRWRSWLRHCATSQKVAGSIPDGVIGIFH